MSGPAVGSYVMAKELPEATTYLTAGRPYLVTSCTEDGLFEITTDRGESSMCLMTNCAHLEGGDWSSVDPLQALEADNAALKAKNKALVEAVLSTVKATRAYLPPDGIDAQECLNRIIGATDNPTINPIILEAENGHD